MLQRRSVTLSMRMKASKAMGNGNEMRHEA